MIIQYISSLSSILKKGSFHALFAHLSAITFFAPHLHNFFAFCICADYAIFWAIWDKICIKLCTNSAKKLQIFYTETIPMNDAILDQFSEQH